jgi:hypothetical protein
MIIPRGFLSSKCAVTSIFPNIKFVVIGEINEQTKPHISKSAIMEEINRH